MKTGKDFVLGEYVILKKPDELSVGDNVRIADFCRISSRCEIGSNCEIAAGVYIAGGGDRYRFKMGEYSSLASGVRVWLSSNEYVNELVTHNVPYVQEIEGDVILERYTGVGCNSVIMPNNHIPEGTVIGALSFVPTNYPFEPWTVYAGCPIRKIKSRNRQKIMGVLEKIHQ